MCGRRFVSPWSLYWLLYDLSFFLIGLMMALRYCPVRCTVWFGKGTMTVVRSPRKKRMTMTWVNLFNLFLSTGIVCSKIIYYILHYCMGIVLIYCTIDSYPFLFTNEWMTWLGVVLQSSGEEDDSESDDDDEDDDEEEEGSTRESIATTSTHTRPEKSARVAGGAKGVMGMRQVNRYLTAVLFNLITLLVQYALCMSFQSGYLSTHLCTCDPNGLSMGTGDRGVTSASRRSRSCQYPLWQGISPGILQVSLQ